LVVLLFVLKLQSGHARYVLLAVFGMEHIMFFLQFLIDLMIAKEPKHVRIARERDVYVARYHL
jgi:hypothetical protein